MEEAPRYRVIRHRGVASRQGLDEERVVLGGGSPTVGKHGTERHQNPLEVWGQLGWSIRFATSSGGCVAASKRSRATWMGPAVHPVLWEVAFRGGEGGGGGSVADPSRRENRPHGSEGGEGASPSRPVSVAEFIGRAQVDHIRYDAQSSTTQYLGHLRSDRAVVNAYPCRPILIHLLEVERWVERVSFPELLVPVG